MAGNHLIPVPKTVSRGASTFVETYWVRAEEVRADVKAIREKLGSDYLTDQRPPEFDTLVKGLGGDPEAAVAWADDWGKDSHSVGAQEVTAAALATMEHPDPRLISNTADNFGMSSDEFKPYLEAGDNPRNQGTLAAVSAMSQAMYEEPNVTVYRGVYGPEAERIREALRAGQTTIDVGTPALTSFSESEDVANAFAFVTGHDRGVVVKTTIPRSSVAMSGRVFPEISGEREVVAMTAGSIEVAASDIRVTSQSGMGTPL